MFIACDFIVYHVQLQRLYHEPLVVEGGWLYPPMAAVLFLPLRSLGVLQAIGVWLLVNLGLALVLLWWCAKQFENLRPLDRLPVAFCLVALSGPLIHSFKWGQVSLLISVLVIAGLRRARGWTVGLAASIKLYPIVFLFLPAVRKRWDELAQGLIALLVCGAIVPLLILGPGQTWTMVSTVLHRLDASSGTEWMFGRSVAFFGGQALGPSLVRWFRDSSHVNANADGPLLFFLPSPAVNALHVLAMTLLLTVTFIRVRDPRFGLERSIMLCLTAFSLLIQPGWHHYFAFMPLATAVALGSSSSTPSGRALAVLGFAVLALPILLLKDVPQSYFAYSRWGGTTVGVLLTWSAIASVKSSPPIGA